MPRQRKPQNGGQRLWTGRVANTTTGSTTTQTVYRIPTRGAYGECEKLAYEVVWTSPIRVVIEGENVYRVSLDEAALKNIIENYENLDLSNVTLQTVNGNVEFTGSVTADGTFTWTINAIAQYTCKLFTNGSAGTEVVLKDIPGNIIEIYNPGTYELKVYQGQTEISNYVAKLVNNSKFTSYVAGDTWKPKDENDECKIGGTLSKGANGALTYRIAKIEGSGQMSLGYVQIIVVTGF